MQAGMLDAYSTYLYQQGNNSHSYMLFGAHLVSPDGKQNLYTDYVVVNNVFNMKNAVVAEADAQYAYPGFSDLEAAGTASVDGLRQAIDSVALKMSQQISGTQ